MSSEMNIVIKESTDVLVVPVQAVSNKNGKYIVSVFLCDDKDAPTKFISLSLDGISGQILSYYSYFYENDKNPKNIITEELFLLLQIPLI